MFSNSFAELCSLGIVETFNAKFLSLTRDTALTLGILFVLKVVPTEMHVVVMCIFVCM
jgi:hypothetical protein